MSLFNCNCQCKCRCAAGAVIVSVIIGVIAAFLQIASVIAIAPIFLITAFGIAIVYLGILQVTAALTCRCEERRCECTTLNTVLAGILGTILFSVILLTVDVAAASVIGSILVGLFLLFFTLMLTGTACLIRIITGCHD